MDLIEELEEAAPEITPGDWRPGDQRYYVTNPARFQAATGWSPKVSVLEGVRRLHAWLREARVPHRQEAVSLMKIAFFGSSLLSAYWNGAATYYRGILKALHAQGHYITFYEPDAYERQQHRDLEPPAWAEVVVYANAREAVLREVAAASGADLIVKASGVGVFDELLEEVVLSYQSPGHAGRFLGCRCSRYPGSP